MSQFGFEPIDTRKRAEIVARQILNAIRSGAFSPGAKLPPERELVEEMGVSRPTLREAIGALQLLGILESRPGDGTYVVRSADPSEIEFQAELLRSFGPGDEESALDLLEARKILEIAIIGMVAERVMPAEIEALRLRVERMRGAKSSEAFFADDAAFHMTIAEASGNPFLARTMQVLLETMRRPWWRKLREEFIFSNDDYVRSAWRAHEEIVQALERGDPAAAADAVKRHYDYSRWIAHVRTAAASSKGT